jgi:hypothetical protein
MSATSQSVEPEQFVGSSHDLETGDEIITNYGGTFDSWGKTVEEQPEMGEDHEDWFKVKGDWDGAVCYDLWYSFRHSPLAMVSAVVHTTVFRKPDTRKPSSERSKMTP